MKEDAPTPAPVEEIVKQDEQSQETKPGQKYGKLSKKNKLLTNSVKRVVGGAKDPGGGWDLNHNQILI